MGNLISSLLHSSSSSDASSQSPLQKAEHHRQEATKIAQQRSSLFEDSKRAWNNGNKPLASSLSSQAHSLSPSLKSHNAQACLLYFNHYNSHRPIYEIDLHGLFVAEALEKVEERIQQLMKLKKKGEKWNDKLSLVVITGWGRHSEGGVAKIKPEVEKFVQYVRLTLLFFSSSIPSH
ncbi:hypothetical protein BKA69DRAFT_1089767 [Paraphysoderma sedebokerense]|nr:hypothetical protein BKA69DRAFT_1089767 [Paraphysoderma sedebokerense]